MEASFIIQRKLERSKIKRMRYKFCKSLSSILFTLIIPVICYDVAYSQKPKLISGNSLNDSLMYISSEWIQDSLGCLNLRTKHIDFIRTHFAIRDYFLYDVLILFGRPNVLYINKATFITDDNKAGAKTQNCIYVSYYYSSSCKDDNLNSQILERPTITFVFSNKGYGLMIR